MNSSFCVLPFYRITIRSDQSMAPCCSIKNFDKVNRTSLGQYWNNEKLINLRKNMMQGIKLSECNSCYQQELVSGSSMRTDSLRDHFVTENTDLEKFVQGPRYLGKKTPNHLEFHLGNLCNLKCLTCGPNDSSSFLSENKILKISNENTSDFEIENSVIERTIKEAVANGIEILDLRGGESMLMPSIRNVIKNLPDNHGIRTLRLQTNCTVLDDFWKETFKKFRRIEIMLSIDAVGDAANYIRYPSKWQQINQNVDYFKSCKNLKLYVNCTISNLNFLLVKDVVDWCRSKQIYFHFSLLTTPSYYQPINLPKTLFEQAMLQNSAYPELLNLNLVHNDSKWKEFCNMISIRDQHRNNSIFDVLPQLKDYWITK